ncbi:sulfur carrier protein ThiS [Rheinheimera sp. MMS21-TC3]|uniref:sulfur carrier protein ThiS n=1 Tax=Rheinheimera sp. MMS21-TC3 TaxID=3072790 RepID=UPI0028C4CFE6|nr:sulfur carrier protein ThiS [Rheinheimera sp. MMS21-TC3]WNO60831.1 sulfur carrier protein ThiS [Rheinheimera sp. MMS21-TC3]
MQITINDIPTEVTSDISLQQVLLSQNINQNGLAVAVNNSVINKSTWQQYQLKANDAVQLFQIVTGG